MNKKIKHITILILFVVGVVFSIQYYFAENEQNLVFTTDFSMLNTEQNKHKYMKQQQNLNANKKCLKMA